MVTDPLAAKFPSNAVAIPMYISGAWTEGLGLCFMKRIHSQKSRLDVERTGIGK